MIEHGGIYEFWKDFAGPLAAVSAAAAATYFAYTFQNRQTKIAENKLRLDLFEKRYAKMLDAKKLIELLAMGHAFSQINLTTVRQFYISMDEGRFLLSPATNEFLDRLHKASEAFLNALAARENINLDNSEEWRRSGDNAAEKLAALRSIYENIPAQFECDLKIETA